MSSLHSVTGVDMRDGIPATHDWLGEVSAFFNRVLLSGRPYFLVSCACDCNRVDCAAASAAEAAPVVVVPIVNNTEGWMALWQEIH